MFWLKPPAVFSQVFQAAWWKMPAETRSVYLTFDDGPHPVSTTYILKVLDQFDAKATFFCLGEQVMKYPDLFQAIKDRGHVVGNHSQHHLNGWTTSKENYLADIRKADQYIGSNLFRPPYGKLSFSQWNALKEQYQIVMWSNMPEDFREDLSSDLILHRLTTSVSPGEIIVLHENDKSIQHLRNILPAFLQCMKDEGFTLKALPHAY